MNKSNEQIEKKPTDITKSMETGLEKEECKDIGDMENEIWVDIRGYEGFYKISSCGRVKSIFRYDLINRPIRERILKCRLDKFGAVCIDLHKNCFIKTVKVHRLVAMAFIPNLQNKPEVNHKDGNRQNNYINNLEWSTGLENIIHAIKNGLIDNCGEKSGNSIFKNNEILNIRNLYIAGITQQKIADMYNTNQSTISKITRRERWKHI